MVKHNRKEHLDRPAYLCGHLVLEFFNNDDVDFKNTAIRRLIKDMRKEINVSVVSIQDTTLDNPERGALLVAIAAHSKSQGQSIVDQVLKFVDANSPGRLVSDEWINEEIP